MSDHTDGSGSSSKSKIIIRIIIAVLLLAAIGSGAFFLKKGNDSDTNTENYSVVSEITETSDLSVKRIRFKNSSISLTVGETAALEIIFEPEDAEDKDIEFKSDRPEIAKVDDKGRLTAVSSGDAVVTAILKSDNTVTATLSVKTADDTDSSAGINSDTDKNKNDKKSDTDSQTKKKDTSSAAESKKSDSDKPSSGSAVSKAAESTVSSKPSQPVYYPTTTAQQPTQQTTQTPPPESKPSEEIVPEAPDIPDSGEFIDPYSAGKSVPICYVGTDEKKVSISFDASWGNDKTQLILDTLEQYNIKSTFFLVGTWVRAYPDDVKKIDQAGHDIGNHSNTHPDLTTLSTAGIRSEMDICSSEIEALTGKRPILFRNPYGAYDDRVVGTALGMGMNCIQWDVDTLDWTNNSGADICGRIKKNIKNGSIILMHNGGGHTAESLPTIIQTIYDLGYEIVPISELIGDGDYTTDSTGRLIPNEIPDTPQSDVSDTSQSDTSQSDTSDTSQSDTSDTSQTDTPTTSAASQNEH
ncbi:MAG: polysaccharide deacetylase family protein [Clostridia bacterium]|nr:polysaccharide deacetylase family protein [Clostridia bacterium]